MDEFMASDVIVIGVSFYSFTRSKLPEGLDRSDLCRWKQRLGTAPAVLSG
jgi:hypothetical protein